MTTRTTTKSVTFIHPFVLGDLDEVFPPGAYSVETDEERVEGVAFVAYRRVSVVFHLPSRTGNPVLARAITMHPRELDTALLRDIEPGAAKSS